MFGQYSEGEAYEGDIWSPYLIPSHTTIQPINYSPDYAYYFDPDEYPSEARFILEEQLKAETEAKLQAEATGGFFDTIKSVITTLSPLAISIIKATTGKDITTVIKAPTTVPVTAAPKPMVAGIPTSSLLIVGLAAGGYMLLKGRKKRGRR